MNTRRRAGAADAEEDGGQDWVITYGDMMTLLVSFFVMLLSMATFVPERLFFLSEHKELERFRKLLEQTYAQMEAYVQEAGLQELIRVEKVQDKIKVTLSQEVSFPSGGAELKEEAKPILDYIADILEGGVYNVNVVGHTDNVPIHTDDYPSNWELSSKRAIAVVDYYVQERGMSPERFRAEGRAEYEPMPGFRIAKRSLENLSAEGVPADILETLGSIENQEVIGEKEFVDVLTTTLGEGRIDTLITTAPGEGRTETLKTVILKHAEPIASNDTPRGRARNRRVEIFVAPELQL